MKFTTLTTILGLVSPIFSTPTATHSQRGEVSKGALESFTAVTMFKKPLEEFINMRNSKEGPSELIWTALGCGFLLGEPNAPDSPTAPFSDACDRRNFGILNYKAQDRFSDDNKDKIDEKFRVDMYQLCATQDDWVIPYCKHNADIYYYVSKRVEDLDQDDMGGMMLDPEAAGYLVPANHSHVPEVTRDGYLVPGPTHTLLPQ